MHCCSGTELALKKRFEEAYSRSGHTVMQAIERQVCGCDFGGNSWTNQAQADEQIRRLGLDEKTNFIEVGAGMGWPGIYMAGQSGARVTLVDLPEIGLDLARRRAVEDGITDRVTTCVADAADLPFPAESFDAISHNDLLCCLVQKAAVLEQCRRIIRPGGVMVFTVIAIVPGLSRADHSRALANAPEFVEAAADYPALLEKAGWRVRARVDLTKAYEESCARQVEADRAHQAGLADIFGQSETEERMAGWISKLAAIRDGLFLRELYECRPQGSGA